MPIELAPSRRVPGRAGRVLATLTLALVPQLVHAQQTPNLSPGDARLDGRRIKPARWTMELVAIRNGKEDPPMHSEQEVRRIEVDGQAALQIVQVFHSPRGTTVDTSVALVDGMKPIRHRSQGVGRVLDLDFAGKVVTGRSAASGASPQSFRNETAEPVFDSGALHIILAAAPLAAGFRARLPMYVHEQGGLLWHDVAVTGEELVQIGKESVPAWQVEVKTSIFNVTYLIGKNGEHLGARATRDNMGFRMVRMPGA
jgi:hypothetical protein